MRRLLFTLLTALLIAAPAHAYLDPGAGSMVLQGLLAALAGVFLAVRFYWSRVKAFFSRQPAPAESGEQGVPQVDEPPGR